MKKNAFWKTTVILLQYKRMLAIGFSGALVGAATFGAGIGMLLPVMTLMFGGDDKKKSSLTDLINDQLAKPDQMEIVQTVGKWLVANLPETSLGQFLVVMVVMVVLTIIGSLGNFLHDYMAITVAYHSAMGWRERIYQHLIRAPMALVLTKESGDRITRMFADTNLLGRGYQALLARSVAEILRGASCLFIAFLLEWRFALLAAVGLPLVVVLLRKFGKAIRRSRRSSLEKQGNMVTNLSEVMKGQMVVKVHNAEGYEGRRFRKINKQMFQFMMKARMARALSSPVLKILSTCGMAMMAIVAAWLIFEYGIEPARFLTVLFLLAASANSVKPLSKLHMQIAESQVGAERILSLLKEPTEPSNFRDGKDFPVLAQHSKSIEFKNITFTYPTGEQPAIEDVSLQVKHGQTVAVVGGNGSGKTTLLSLLPRLFEPQSGQILIDGRDIAEVRLRSLRQQMAVVTQKPVLFQGTIAQNIAYGHQYISRQKIEAAAKSAYADQFISELPDGYETKLGEDGVGLSGGQSQRLCIARAILREPLIMILDEATSQIDSDSENKINQAMRELRGGRTIFIIAHRLSTVIDADVIVVMDDGQIVDQGTHLELLGRCNAYKTLTQTQLQPPAA